MEEQNICIDAYVISNPPGLCQSEGHLRYRRDEITISFPDAHSANFRHRPSNEIEIGLDNVYRVSDAGSYWPLDNHIMVATKGHWGG